ncbi:MAG: SIS domain-containing protein [Chlamydiae bacterium]|nr:SIS domain-containing protein [Chlamydiota bacterium]MBI3277974.1 SIS domain-containing protein [Chlamydiota bacterium]
MAAASLVPGFEVLDTLVSIKEVLEETQRAGKKVMVAGNGGSAGIAGHLSVDLTKSAGVRCINFNEAGLITCFSNDYGYERWVEKAVYFYGEPGDTLIVISSSGRSKNILNGCQAARQKQCGKIITLSGFEPDNPLRQLGDINLWVGSKAYNIVETIHQLWLLAVVDLIIGKAEYSSDRETVLLSEKGGREF